MRSSIRKRLTMVFIGLAVGPLMLVGAVLAWLSFTTQQQQALNLQQEMAQRVATEATAFFEGLENELRVVSQVQGLQRLDRDKQQSVLSELLSYNDVFEALVLLDNKGQEQIHLSRFSLVSTSLDNRAEAVEFIVPQTTGEVYYSPVRFDEATGEPLMTIALPLLNAQTGLTDAVLVSEIRIKKIWDLIASVRIDEGQSVYIVDAQDKVVAHRDPSIVLKGTDFNVPDQDGIQPGLTGANAVLATDVDILDRLVLWLVKRFTGGDAVLAVDTAYFGEQEFNIIAEQIVSEAWDLAINTVLITAVLVVAALVVAGGLGFLTVHQLVQPIQTMAKSAEAISAGDLSQQVEITNRDELGVLAGAFNSMTAQLRNLINSLEQRVADRTYRLEIVATLGERLNAILDPGNLLREVVNQVKQNFGYYHTHIYLLDDAGENLVVVAGTGDAGEKMIASGHSIPLKAQSSLVVRAASSGKIVMVDDVRQAEDWLPHPLLPETRAEIAVPIMQKDEIMGVLDVQANKVGGLDEGDANLLRSLANNVAVALSNARLFAQTTQAKEEAEQAREETEMANKAMEVQIWHTTGQAELNDKMRGEQDIFTLANNIVQQLCHYLQAQIGALYIAEDDRLNLVGCYAYSSKKSTSHFKLGEGLVGQAALEKRPMFVTDVPNDYITVRSGLGETVPKHIMLLPFMYDERVVGVVELGTLTEFSQVQLEFIQIALANIAIAFNTAQARTRINELLNQTQQQAEELQAQGEELRVTNEELEAQTESLRASETKLKEKQSELEATNTQLEEKAAALEESSSALRKKQATLDRQNQELKVAQQQLEQRAEELALASKYKSEFLANMSHELRTPLNSLLILGRMLVDNEEGNLTEEQIESAQIICGAGTDLLNLINDILDLSKVESGKMIFNIEPMPLTDLVTMARARFAHVAEEKGLELNLTLADDLPPSIETDQQRVQQIIKNLLSNAFKFTSEGSVSLNIYRPEAGVALSRSRLDPSQAIAVSVIDTGIGMAPDQQKIIFEAFQQADGSTNRQYGGTGLGLSISRELAAKLGGQIEVESELGQGSTFTLYLPLERQADESKEELESPEPAEENREVPEAKHSLPQPPSSLAPQPATLQLSPPDDRVELEAGDKILLIIEDDPKFAKIVYNFAHKNGFKCLIAGDGKTGLTLVKNYKPEAIILDLNLPDMSGWEILQVLKNDPATRHIPVHIISADEEVLDAYRKGAIGYLTKPVSQADLDKPFQKIEQFISREIKTLLLVEDDANSRRSIKKLLGGSDVQISETDRGQAALELLQAQHFDCIILDLTLPDMSGFEVLNKMNGHEAESRCPVIVYTGRDLTPDENLELMKYADSVIVKGVKSPERLLDETALFLHRVVAEMPEDKQQTIKQLYNEDGLLKDKKILIVDDDVRNSFALSKLLSDKGISVRIAQNGQKALELLAKEPIDLVLMDIMMPVMDGYETTKRIRAQQEFSTLPILALTAKAMKGDREKCLAVGANDYLPKPIDVDRLFSMLRVWLYQ
jgi:tubulin-specific chaperone A